MSYTDRVHRRDKRRINNPFPGRPKGLGFINGGLFYNPNVLLPQCFPVGAGFELKWEPENGGILSVIHRSEPTRILWSTVRGVGFISAALSNHLIEESRGSIAIHDNTVTVCRHQTVEDISVIYASKDQQISDGLGEESDNERCALLREAQFRTCTYNSLLEGTQLDKAKGPIVILTGCLYSTSKLAQEQLEHFFEQRNHSKGPFYSSNSGEEEGCCPGLFKSRSVAVRYTVSFVEKLDHQLGFRVNLSDPTFQPFENSSSSHTESLVGLKRTLGDAEPMRHCVGIRRRIRSPIEPPIQNGILLRRGASSLLKNFRRQLHRLQRSASIDTQKRLIEKKLNQRPTFNRIAITFSSQKDEKFYGFGEQFSYMDMKGKRVPILVQEQGLGRGDQPITAAANLVAYRSGGDWSTTYAPSPFYMTSTMKCLYLEGYDYSVFDLTKDDRGQIQVYGSSVQGRILHGSSPTELIERYTESIGRMQELPNWVLSGAIVGMQGGTESVRHVWDQLQKYNVPISAFWLQDWVGQRRTSIGLQLWWNWEVDTTRYSGWRQLLEDLHSNGIQTMTYCNPCITPTDKKVNRRRNFFEEANKQGLFVKDKSGSTYMIPNTTFDVGMLDLTNPLTRSWFKGILQEMVDTGVRGWMADFGEGLPLDAILFSGEDPASAHNRYPELWAEINREFVEEWKSKKQEETKTVETDGSRLDEDQLVFFVRAGFRESPKWATLFWEGDQMVSWQRNDGIKSAIVGLLSGGLSGYALNHSDIGGYCAVNMPFLQYRRSEELLLRWMELNALTTIFRTHEGNLPSANKQFYSNDRTLLHFSRFAKVYKAWEFYRIQLVKEAATKGLPVVRHLFLHFPHDQYVQKLTFQQFLVGSEILVVPVVDKGKNQVEAYFPAGQDWQHIWTGRIFSSPKSSTVEGRKIWIHAPLGYPAIFVKAGSHIGRTFMKNLMDLGVACPEEYSLS
eukprot:Gb_08338 [translate_table: standard]